MLTKPAVPPPFPFGARLDYSARVAARQVEALADGAAVTLEVGPAPLTFRRMGAAFHLTTPGQAPRTVAPASLPPVLWAAAAAHFEALARPLAAHTDGGRLTA